MKISFLVLLVSSFFAISACSDPSIYCATFECGGSCCLQGQGCYENACCTPASCGASGYACGSWPEGCGGAQLNCGTCPGAMEECSPQGQCVTVDCKVDSDCADQKDCTDDVCTDGTCTNPANTAVCDDGLYCNGTDSCGGGTCSVHSGDPCDGVTPYCIEDADSCDECVGAGIV